ncbi:sodium/potassium-transporting ATPase subunit beta-1-interacting protein isoform X1 [Anastrepha obliqua]|uniref:sodium/potassium-transporting ATPase subunit beta-1-interacting protein isoform X1 n=1 Tax=Anastrepha obliqua TaxID=95512 RepID=UPI002409E7A8|nr:sodium/potassium-transporting ATPase subunit beta-1-interacting protein isoform X1 [Anastrepha obliqua]
MWAPILVNFFHIIFIILGFYGAYHFRIKYIITYLIWSFIWIGWNAFLICFYLNVGVLDRDSDLLNLGTGSVSWFEVNGYGCKPTYPVNITSDDPFRPIRPERVDDCLLDYTIVEVVESGVQCALALLGILGAILISYIFLDEDDRFDFVNGDAKSPQHTVVHPMYVSYSSIPTSASASATLLSNKHHNNHQALSNNNNHHQIHPQQQQLQLQQQLHHQQPNNFNSNTFLIHTNSISNNSHSHSHSRSHSHNHSQSNSRSRSRSNSQSGGIAGSGATRKGRGGGGGGGDGNSNSLSASKNSTLTRILYSPKSSNKIGSSTGNTIQPTDMLQRQQSLPQTHTTTMSQGAQHYYDDSTAKADQLYTNSNRRQFLNGTTYQQQQQQQQQHVGTPNSSSHDNTTSSLSYASLQNSNLNLTQSLRGVGGGPSGGFGYTGSGGGSVSGGGGVMSMGGGVGSSSGGGVGGLGRGGGGSAMTAASSQATLSPLSNSQFSLSNSLNNNYSNHSGSNNNSNNNNTNNNINVLNNHTNYMNNNNGSVGSGVGGGHFARIHAKPKPPKSTSYSSFINNGSAANLTGGGGSMTNVHRPDIKYTQMSNERLSRNLEEGLEDDNFSLQNFKTDDGITYVPFQKPTPGALFVGQNNNPSYVSLNSYAGTQMSPNNNASPNTINNNALPQFTRSISQLAPPPPTPPSLPESGEILLERGAVLQPAYNYQPHPQQQMLMMQASGPTHMQTQPPRGMQSQQQSQPQPLLNPANRFLYQQNGLPFHPAYNKPIPVPPPVPTHTSPPMPTSSYHHMSPAVKQPPRPTNIPLPTIPPHSFDTPISPSEVTPPPPPAPRPHIFQPRSGHAPYPDLSPEVTEKYAMPTQYVPRSPVASRIARRQRQQQQPSHNYHHQPAQPATHHVNTSANFCDQVRDAPPGYIVDAGFSIVRAKSYDRLASVSSSSGSVRREAKGQAHQQQAQQVQVNAEAAPHVNRRSGRRDAAGRARPRSYCNSMSGGEGVIRGSLVYERDFAVESAAGGGSGIDEGCGNVGGDQLA